MSQNESIAGVKKKITRTTVEARVQNKKDSQVQNVKYRQIAAELWAKAKKRVSVSRVYKSLPLLFYNIDTLQAKPQTAENIISKLVSSGFKINTLLLRSAKQKSCSKSGS